MMALLSILPAVGPALVWLPAAIILLVNDHIAAGVALILIGVLVIGLVDNVLRPILVGRDTRMPDYLIMLSTLGGLAAFGLAGIVIGPIIAAFFLARVADGADGVRAVAVAGSNAATAITRPRRSAERAAQPARLAAARLRGAVSLRPRLTNTPSVTPVSATYRVFSMP